MVSGFFGSINMLRYNDLLITLMLSGRFSGNDVERADLLHGYVPLQVEKQKIPLIKEHEDMPQYCSVNPGQLQKIEYIFKKLKTKGISIIVAISPTFYDYTGGKDMTYNIWDSICQKHHIPIIDDSDVSYFSSHPEWFKDINHLNSDGADEYTRFFINQLKEQCSIN